MQPTPRPTLRFCRYVPKANQTSPSMAMRLQSSEAETKMRNINRTATPHRGSLTATFKELRRIPKTNPN